MCIHIYVRVDVYLLYVYTYVRVVGFQQLSYNVTEEEEGGVELAIQLTTGSRVTDESVVVNIVLNNGTADGV